MSSVLYTKYKNEVVPAMKEKFGYKNSFDVPALKKIVLNVGYGRHVKDKAYIENIEKTLTSISGQKPVHNLAKKSISNFKLREGMDIGMSVTLRGERMWEFLYKFINITLPRVRDFRGLSTKSFDKTGNYSMGIKESTSFPEVTVESTERIHSLQIVFTISSKTKDEGKFLLEKIGFPFKQ